MTNSMTLPAETSACKRSTRNGEPAEVTAYGPESSYPVPSYVTLPGHSVQAAAKSLGLRVLGRRESREEGNVVAEIHERGQGGFLCVLAPAE
jgi:hypothetical protein